MNIRSLPFLLLLSLCSLKPCVVDAQVYNVRLFGAMPEGKVLATAAVQKAIDACHS